MVRRATTRRIVLMALVLLVWAGLEPLGAQGLSGFFLRRLGAGTIFRSVSRMAYLLMGGGSLFALVSAFRAFGQGDDQAGERAQNLGLSLLFAIVCVLVVSLLFEDVRDGVGTVDLGSAVTRAEASLKTQYAPVVKLLYVVSGIIALLVLPSRFGALQRGDPGAGGELAAWCGGLVLLPATLYLIRLTLFA